MKNKRKYVIYKRGISLILSGCLLFSAVTGCGTGNRSEIVEETENRQTKAESEVSETETEETSTEETMEKAKDETMKPDQEESTEFFEDLSEEEGNFPEEEALSSTQRNSINMLNYIMLLTREINDSRGSRVFLETAYSSLINDLYPNAIDSMTQAQLNSTLDTLKAYRMITVKRERLEYLYEQNQAQALREAIPNPMGLLSAVQSESKLEMAISVFYMAADSVASYESAASQADLQYLQDGWELDDEEDQALYSSRDDAFNYMISIVREYSFPGDYALNEEAVQAFVEWKNNSNPTRKIAWLEANQERYSEFGPYWLELARSYYDSEEYEACLEAVHQYEKVATRIFRKDMDYAEALPVAIGAAKETMDSDAYVETAGRYAGLILENTNEDDWTLRYFAAQIYIDLYGETGKSEYLSDAYQIVFNNVNVLVDEQRELNKTYLADVQETKAEKGATKRQKQEVKQYNKLLKKERKTELPPVSEALYLNCDLLFALAEKQNIPEKEKKRIDSILHENGERIFLTEPLDDRFWFYPVNKEKNADEIEAEFTGEDLTIPAVYLTDRYQVQVTIAGDDGVVTMNDWIIKKVSRPKSGECSEFKAVLSSQSAEDHKYHAGEMVTVRVIPSEDSEKELIFTFDAVSVKKWLGKKIVFERNRK